MSMKEKSDITFKSDSSEKAVSTSRSTDLEVPDNDTMHTDEENGKSSMKYKMNKKTKIIACATILFTQFVEAFAQDSTSELSSYATSAFNAHSMVSTAQLVYKITAVCAYPVLGKIADLLGRGEGFGIVVFCYTLCYILFATCPNVATFIVGYSFFAIGRVGFKTMLIIFIADNTNLINRGIMTQLPAALTGIVTTYSGSYIEDAFLAHSTWRWDYGAWAIILGVSVIPLTLVMLYCDRIMKERSSRKKAMIFANIPQNATTWGKIKHVLFIEMDFIGGCLLMSGTALFFVPFTITGNSNPQRWSDAGTIVMLVLGFILLVCFFLWCFYSKETKFLTNRLPFIPVRAFRNPTLLVAFFIVALDYCENAAFAVYFSTCLQVGGYYSAGQAGRISDAKKISIDIASIIVGIFMKYTKRTKIWVLIGIPILVLGHGLLVWFVNRNQIMETNTVLIYVMEIFTGVGRGFYTTALQVTIQAIAGVGGIAMSTAFFLAFNSVGTLIGTAIAGGIWNNVALSKLEEHLPDEYKKNATTIFSNIKVALKYKKGTELRTAVSLAYRETVQIIGWTTLGIVAPCLILMFFVREVELTDKNDLYGSDSDSYTSADVDEKEFNTSLFNREKRTWRNWWRV
uniref:MFS transporter n=1 Tax=Cyberlindnera americana TaxID=36016 RepID=A0A5P8N8V3_9ASCO|nr:MFS transporter [Cyberlindnera americana]